MEWILKVRPTVDGRPDIIQYLPMYQQLLEDEWVWIMYKLARQMLKSSIESSWLGFYGTTKANSKSVFVTHEDEALSTFSIEKFREPLWIESAIANQYLKDSSYGAIGLVQTEINASIRLVTDAHEFKHVEGKAADLLEFDEGNHIDWEKWVKAKESQSFTHGRRITAGIGGISGTEYHKLWKSTDQRKWIWDKKTWREKLEFRKSGTNRLIFGDYMLDYLDGHWRAKIPENGSRHGYHLSQYDAPWIPLKKIDAVELYGLPEDESIEWKEEHYPQTEFIQHVLAEFVEGDIKPITEEMMFRLLDRNLGFVSSDKIEKHRGKIYLGADWGGGKKTIIWIWQCINNVGPVFQLLFARMANTDDVNEQYEMVRDHIEAYQVDQAVVDAGGGTHQVQRLSSYFGPRCLKNHFIPRPEKPLPDEKERQKYRKENKFEIDKTYSLDSIVDLIRRPYVTDRGSSPRIIIPANESVKKEASWIIEQFTNEEVELVKHKTTGQQYRRYYTPDPKLKPDDALLACDYAWIAWLIDTQKPEPMHFRISS